MIRLSAPEAAALGCRFVVEVAVSPSDSEPEFFFGEVTHSWLRNPWKGLRRSSTIHVRFARPATDKELSNVD